MILLLARQDTLVRVLVGDRSTNTQSCITISYRTTYRREKG